MRWKEPQQDDIKIIRKFLLLPLTINGETRWLEIAKIKLVYNDHKIYSAGRYAESITGWTAIEFVD